MFATEKMFGHSAVYTRIARTSSSVTFAFEQWSLMNSLASPDSATARASAISCCALTYGWPVTELVESANASLGNLSLRSHCSVVIVASVTSGISNSAELVAPLDCCDAGADSHGSL